ncbi:MAG: TonB family protein, partial [Muribaculaceae bacterium]|nr:TonB family protein [Muribaculaceae bacterium]
MKIYNILFAVAVFMTNSFYSNAQPLSTPDMNLLEVKGNVKSVFSDSYSVIYRERMREVEFNRSGYLKIPQSASAYVKRDYNNKITALGDYGIQWKGKQVSEINSTSYRTLLFYNNKGLCSRIVANYRSRDEQEVMDVNYNKFDNHGNWIMRTAVNIRTGETKVETRYITYYSAEELSKVDEDVSSCSSNTYNNSRVEREEDDGVVYKSVEQMPQFPGGEAELMRYVSKSIKYPTMAMENNIQGRVVVQFVVTKTGAIGEVKVIRSKDPDLDKEAVR